MTVKEMIIYVDVAIDRITELGHKLTKEEIINVESNYDKWVQNLKKIKSKLKLNNNDFDFAQRLFNIPVNKRINFLEEEIEKYLSDKTIDEAIELNKLIEVFYGK